MVWMRICWTNHDLMQASKLLQYKLSGPPVPGCWGQFLQVPCVPGIVLPWRVLWTSPLFSEGREGHHCDLLRQVFQTAVLAFSVSCLFPAQRQKTNRSQRMQSQTQHHAGPNSVHLASHWMSPTNTVKSHSTHSISHEVLNENFDWKSFRVQINPNWRIRDQSLHSSQATAPWETYRTFLWDEEHSRTIECRKKEN
jgi:hypothetical protein